MVRVVIDGNVFGSPDNWEELKSSFKRDDKSRTILLTTDGTYDFSGDAFTYINDKINDEGFCTSLAISFQEMCSGSWVQTISGNIFLSDCEVNERTCVVSVRIQDDSFYAKINNNKKIKTSPQAERSKNNLTIPTAPTYNLDIYKQSNDSLLKNNVPAIRIFDVFRYFIDFVSDGTLTFVSSTFDVGGTWEGLCIVNGERLRLNSAVAFQQFSLESALKEVNNKIPIILAIEENNGAKVVRIESSDYYDQQSITYTFTNIYEIQSKFETNNLYSVVKFGGQVFAPLNVFTPEQLPLFGFKEEEFGVLGVCNVDNTLDLSSDWIASPNIIYEIVQNSSQDFDTDIILIDSILVDATNGRTRNTNFFGLVPASYTYNEGLTNYNTALRHFQKIPNAIASYFEPSGTGTFLSFIDTTLGTVVASSTYPSLPFPNVVFNISGYFDGNDKFTAGLNGVYRNTVFIEVNVTNPSTGITLRLYADRYNSSNVLTGSYNIDDIGIGVSGTYSIGGTFDSSLTKTDYLYIRLEILPAVNPIAFTFSNSSYWKIDDNSLNGGIFETYDPDDYPVRIFEFDYPLTKNDFEYIIASPYGFVLFSQDGQSLRRGLIKELVYNHVKGIASLKLITNKNTIDAT